MINGKKDFIDLSSFNKDEIMLILDTAVSFKKKVNDLQFRPLEGKVLGMIFSKSSTRTRVSFEAGIYKLGGQGIFLSQNDLQLGRGETIPDTARVLERYLDALMIRTYNHQDVIELAENCSIPVINGLTDYNHPCQVMADFLTIYEKKGSVSALKTAYVGDGNNMANSLALCASRVGMELHIATPEGYECAPEIMETLAGSSVTFSHDPAAACKSADVIYTDVWVSMGQEKERADRLRDLKDFQVNEKLLSVAAGDYIFMHCLPAHREEEVTAEVLDGSHSVVFDQAENRLHAQNAVLFLLLSDNHPAKIKI